MVAMSAQLQVEVQMDDIAKSQRISNISENLCRQLS